MTVQMLCTFERKYEEFMALWKWKMKGSRKEDLNGEFHYSKS